MALVNINSYPKLSFDEEHEADILKFVNDLSSSHKLGQFLSNLVRIAVDCPEIMGADRIKKLTESYDRTVDRQAFFSNISKQTSEMQDKINKMYSMVFNMYILAQMGKTLGIEEKSKNALMAQFVIEKQFKELQDLVGESLTSNALASNRLQSTEKVAEDVLQYIIESYSGIISELKQIQSTQIISVQQPVTQVANTVENKIETVVNKPETSSTKASEQGKVNNNTAEEEEYIDFGDADISMLSDFFGDE